MKKLLCVLLFILSGSVQLRSQNPNTAKFPGAIVADADIGVAKNRARTQLSGPINDTDLTISVDNGAAFASPSWASVDQEFLKICGVAVNTLTVCEGGRGAFGSTAAAHQSGSWISGPLLDQHVNQLAAEVRAIETALGINLVNVPQYWSKTGDDLSYTSGRVGIGASSPGPMFYLYSAGDTSLAVEKNGGMAAALGAGTFASVFQYDSTGNFGIFADTRDHIRGGILGGTPALMATSTGNVLVGTDTDDTSGAKLQVNGSVKATGFTGPITGNVTGNVSGNAGTVTNGVYGGSNLTTTGRAVYTSAAGTVSQSSATLSSAGTMQIPAGQSLQLLSGGANMTFQSGLSGAVLWGDASSAGWFSLGPANSNDSTVSFKYARGTIGGQAGVLSIGQLAKTNANWTHAATTFYSLGVERARIDNAALSLASIPLQSNDSVTAGDRAAWVLNANNTLRWKIGLHGDESGANAGSGLSFWSYDDAGNYIAAPLQMRRTGAVLLNSDTDNGVDKLQVAGGIFTTNFMSAVGGAFAAKGRFGATEPSIPRADMSFNARFVGPNWVRDDDTKTAAIWTLNHQYSDLYVAPAAAGNIEWTAALRVLSDGDVSIPKRHQQINFTLYDPNVALAAQTIPGLWRSEYTPVTATAITQVSCMADTADAVIQIKKNTSTNVLSANLTCGNGGWLFTTTFAAASLSVGDDIGLQVISGTAKRINVSIKYTGN